MMTRVYTDPASVFPTISILSVTVVDRIMTHCLQSLTLILNPSGVLVLTHYRASTWRLSAVLISVYCLTFAYQLSEVFVISKVPSTSSIHISNNIIGVICWARSKEGEVWNMKQAVKLILCLNMWHGHKKSSGYTLIYTIVEIYNLCNWRLIASELSSTMIVLSKTFFFVLKGIHLIYFRSDLLNVFLFMFVDTKSFIDNRDLDQSYWEYYLFLPSFRLKPCLLIVSETFLW